MLAVTLHQPWAALVVAGVKPDDTRSWRTHYRGPIAIHAGWRIDLVDAPLDLCCRVLGVDWAAKADRARVVAIAQLVDCVPTEQVREDPRTSPLNLAAGDFSDGRWAWRLADVRPLREAIPASGRQGLWRWPAPIALDDLLLPPIDHQAVLANLQAHNPGAR